jgi:hypothetical protein
MADPSGSHDDMVAPIQNGISAIIAIVKYAAL